MVYIYMILSCSLCPPLVVSPIQRTGCQWSSITFTPNKGQFIHTCIYCYCVCYHLSYDGACVHTFHPTASIRYSLLMSLPLLILKICTKRQNSPSNLIFFYFHLNWSHSLRYILYIHAACLMHVYIAVQYTWYYLTLRDIVHNYEKQAFRGFNLSHNVCYHLQYSTVILFDIVRNICLNIFNPLPFVFVDCKSVKFSRFVPWNYSCLFLSTNLLLTSSWSEPECYNCIQYAPWKNCTYPVYVMEERSPYVHTVMSTIHRVVGM